MIGARAKLMLGKAKQVPKHNQNSTPSQPQPSNSRPAVGPSSSSPSPPCTARKTSAIPQLILSTLYKTNDESLNSSNDKERDSLDSFYNSNSGSRVSGVSRLSNSECGETKDAFDVDVEDILNTAYHEEAPSEKM